jgi:ABC-type transport system substrate-binding protein
LLGTVALGAMLLAGCTAMPPVPVVPSSGANPPTTPGANVVSAVVAVDTIAGGYNPHQIADQSTVTTALADLMLPSVFRTGADGTPTLDRNLMVSAQVTNANPYTVTYAVRSDASWSDGAPIDATDFVYLRNQMSSQPGVVDAAGYRLISAITGRNNDKVVQVTFSQPYPGWRSLFTDLLPAHLVKDAPGGWAGALADSFPATAGPFDIRKIDALGGEITLERSDRYWGKPSVLDQLVLRKSATSDTVDALRTGADQIALSQVDAAGLGLMRGLGATASLSTVPTGVMAAVLLRPTNTVLSNPDVRGAVAAALDRNALIAAGTGGGPSADYRADALVVPPSRPGYRPTVPAGRPQGADPATVSQLLTKAGYTQTGGLWGRGGQILRLAIAAPANREPYVTIARTVQKQLATAGISATLSTPPAGQLYNQELGPVGTAGGAPTGGQPSGGAGEIDILVGPQPAAGDPPTELASWFGCPMPNGSGTIPPGGPLGWCDPTQQSTITAALTGAMALPDALASIEPALWAQNIDIPLFQVCEELAIGREVTGVSAGPPLVGPFDAAASWDRSKG